jgi:hypothetical protein
MGESRGKGSPRGAAGRDWHQPEGDTHLVEVALAALAVAVVVNRAGGEELPASEVAQTVVRADSPPAFHRRDGR